MKRAHNFVLSWQLYPHDVMVSVGETEAQVLRRIRRTAYELTPDEIEQLSFKGRVGRTVMLRGGQTILWVQRFNGDPASVAVLAHEAYHAVCMLLERVGVAYSDSSDEAFAYALEWLMRTILARLGA